MKVTWLLVFALLGQGNNNKRESGENKKKHVRDSCAVIFDPLH